MSDELKPTEEINPEVSGVDLLLFFQNKHLVLENAVEGLTLKYSEEIKDKFPNVQQAVMDFLYYVDDFKVTIEDADNDQDGQDI
jgi:hypothetical protein